LPVQPCVAACLGMAGIDRPADRASIQRWAAARQLAGEVLVVNDARLVIAAKALRAATCAADGRGPPTVLLTSLLDHWGLQQPTELIEYIYGLADPRA